MRKKEMPPLELKKANIHRPFGSQNRGRFELRDDEKIVHKSDHSTVNDASIQGSARSILAKARAMGRKIRTKAGIIDPSDEDNDGSNSDLI